MSGNIPIFRKLDTISTHFSNNVLPKYNNFLCTVLYSTWITSEDGRWNFASHLLCDGIWDCRPEKSSVITGSLYTKFVANALTNYHTILHFDALKIYSCGKHCEKRRNCL